MPFMDYFRKKKQVPSRQPSPAPREATDKDAFVLSPPAPQEIAGTSLYQTQVTDYMKAVRYAVAKNTEHNDGIPFRLSPTLETIWLTNEGSKLSRPTLKNIDWNSFEYSFHLEKSVLGMIH